MIATAQQLIDLTKAIFIAAGSSEAEALAIGENLVTANLNGHDSHGIGMVPRYIDNLQRGVLNANQHISIISDRGSIVQVEGNLGYGQVIGPETMEIGIAKAREYGVAILALRNSHHLGRIGALGEQCTDEGFVSINYVNLNGHGPMVAPFGGAEARFATNPYCVAIPATDKTPRTVLDMATSMVAQGKVRVAHNKGEKIADGTLIGSDGAPTNDPGVLFNDPRGAILPFGAHKGGGMSLICELLGGALVNGGGGVPDKQTDNTIVNNMLSIILDPAAVGDLGYFRQELDTITDYVKSSRPAAGVEEVMVPGDPERKSKAARGAAGIPIDDTTWRDINTAANLAGLSTSDVEKFVSA